MLLSKYCPSVEVMAEGSSVEEGVALIKQHDPDLLFLDIQLTDGSGFDILTSFESIRSKVIFTTAYDSYAIQAFKFSAIDYLLKPIDPDQLIALHQRLHKMDQSEELKKQIQLLNENKNKIKRIALSSTQGVFYILIEEIVRCEADSNYTNFYLKDQSKIVVAKSLKEYEDLLSGINFFRVHKSHLVNMQYVKKFDNRTGMLILEDGFQVEVARRRKDALVNYLMKTD
jgi:two-component system LytT family response regulator